MEIINSENLIGALLVLGYESVDSILYTLTLGKITKDNRNFKFIDKELNKTFMNFIDYDGGSFKLKEGLTMQSDTGLLNEYFSIEEFLTNRKLVEYLKTIDLNDIISKKNNFVEVKTLEKKI